MVSMTHLFDDFYEGLTVFPLVHDFRAVERGISNEELRWLPWVIITRGHSKAEINNATYLNYCRQTPTPQLFFYSLNKQC